LGPPKIILDFILLVNEPENYRDAIALQRRNALHLYGREHGKIPLPGPPGNTENVPKLCGESENRR